MEDAWLLLLLLGMEGAEALGWDGDEEEGEGMDGLDGAGLEALGLGVLGLD